MALQFTADAEVGDAELFVHLDIDGLAALLRAIQSAMESGEGRLTADACCGAGITPGGDATKAFGKVTVTFARPVSESRH